MADINKRESKCNTRSSFWNKKWLNRKIIKDIMDGVDNLKEKGYLIQSSGESRAKYEKRLEQALLNPILENQIKAFVEKAFKQGVTLESDNEFIKSLEKNFDGYDRTITEFAKDLFLQAETYSEGYVFIDMPAKKIDELGNIIVIGNERPTCEIINLDSILHTRDNGHECNYLRFKEYKTVEDYWDDKSVEIVKEIYKKDNKVYFNIYEIHDGQEFLQNEKDTLLIDLDYIPIVPLYPAGHKKLFEVDLLWKNMARLQIGHFNAYSHYLNLSKANSTPILFGKKIGKDGDKIVMGAGVILASDEEAAALSYVEPSGNSLSGSLTTVQKIENDMDSYGLNVNIGQNSGGTTATQSAIDYATINSILSSHVIALKQSIEKIILVQCEWMGISNPEFTVNIPTDFNIKGDQLMLQAINDAHDRRVISDKVYAERLKELGYLSDSYDREKDLDEMQLQSPNAIKPITEVDLLEEDSI